jgi:heterodisulfide reductase subunit C
VLTAVSVYLTYTLEQAKSFNGALAIVSAVLALLASIICRRSLTGSSRALGGRSRQTAHDADRDIPINWQGTGFMREVERRSGAYLGACYQCHKCSSGCPVGQDAELLSSQIMRLIHLGADNEVLASRAIWLCASCQACSARCPMGVDVAAVMDALRMMAVERGTVSEKARGNIFGLSFLNSVRRHGRAYELGLMAAYKLRSGDLFSDLDKAPKMFAQGKLSLFPKRSPNARQAREAFKRSASEEEKG